MSGGLLVILILLIRFSSIKDGNDGANRDRKR
jgi:hypothetical protein